MDYTIFARSMSDASRPRVPPVRRVKAADGEGIQESEQEGLRAEQKRRLKSEEWMKKVSMQVPDDVFGRRNGP